MTSTATGQEARTRRWDDRLFLSLVAVLPLHTVFVTAWISWKPFLVLLVVLAGRDVVVAVRERAWPWHPRLSVAVAVLGLAVLPGFPADPALRERFLQLGLALGAGAVLLLVSERRLRRPGMVDRALRVVFVTAGAMGATALVLSAVAVGAFGEGALATVNDLPFVFRLMKPAYLTSGFIAVTNWHQDPGYSAAWSVLWSVLALFAALRGRGSGSRVVDGAVIGGLWLAVVMAFSRTGWVSLLIATALAGIVVIRQGAPAREVLARYAVAGGVTLVLLLGVAAVDVPEVGGDLDLQLAFRLSQGWDLLADLTGLFAGSESFAERFDVSEERADVWPEYVAMFRDHPVFGVGLGVGWMTSTIRQEPHNLALELLAETGLVGSAAFGVLVAVVAASGAGALGAVALATAFLPSLTQTVLFEPTWWFAAALYVAGRNETTDRPSHLECPAGGA